MIAFEPHSLVKSPAGFGEIATAVTGNPNWYEVRIRHRGKRENEPDRESYHWCDESELEKA